MQEEVEEERKHQHKEKENYLNINTVSRATQQERRGLRWKHNCTDACIQLPHLEKATMLVNQTGGPATVSCSELALCNA